jgi:hypothetical protein
MLVTQKLHTKVTKRCAGYAHKEYGKSGHKIIKICTLKLALISIFLESYTSPAQNFKRYISPKVLEDDRKNTTV